MRRIVWVYGVEPLNLMNAVFVVDHRYQSIAAAMIFLKEIVIAMGMYLMNAGFVMVKMMIVQIHHLIAYVEAVLTSRLVIIIHMPVLTIIPVFPPAHIPQSSMKASPKQSPLQS